VQVFFSFASKGPSCFENYRTNVGDGAEVAVKLGTGPASSTTIDFLDRGSGIQVCFQRNALARLGALPAPVGETEGNIGQGSGTRPTVAVRSRQLFGKVFVFARRTEKALLI
jgi:hypothetical protein